MMPEDEIAEYEKKFEKDRRARLREDKLREQEALQKERVQRALERAQAAPRNQVGRRPVPRSEPPRVKGPFETFFLEIRIFWDTFEKSGNFRKIFLNVPKLKREKTKNSCRWSSKNIAISLNINNIYC